VFIVIAAAVVYFVMTQSGNFWIYPRIQKRVNRGMELCNSSPMELFCDTACHDQQLIPTGI